MCIRDRFQHDLQWDVDKMGESEPFGEYTPYNFIYYSEDDEHVCQHEYFRTINAPMQEVHDWFMDWKNIPPAFDLIDTVRFCPYPTGWQGILPLLRCQLLLCYALHVFC